MPCSNLSFLPIIGSMNLLEIDKWFKDYLGYDQLRVKDSALNGLQVGRIKQDILKVAFAVDACLETFERAAQWGADLVFVHHGLFWGRDLPITGSHYKRLKTLMDNDIALYAMHLPLDMHPEVGNNGVMAKILGLQKLKPFGEYKGTKIGFMGNLPEAEPLKDIVAKLFGGFENTLKVLPFGPEMVQSIGMVSGGGAMETYQAIEKNLDLYITGDASHTLFHPSQEGEINVIFGGHYATEIWGVQTLCEKLYEETGIDTLFIDVPTGL